MAGFYKSKPLSYAMISANLLILFPIVILLSRMGYSWKGPLETILSNSLTQGEPLRASSPGPRSQYLNTSKDGVSIISLSNLSQCLVILTVKMHFLVSRREPPVLFCAHYLWSCLWALLKRVCLSSLCTLSSGIHTLRRDPPPRAFSGSPTRRNAPVSVS